MRTEVEVVPGLALEMRARLLELLRVAAESGGCYDPTYWCALQGIPTVEQVEHTTVVQQLLERAVGAELAFMMFCRNDFGVSPVAKRPVLMMLANQLVRVIAGAAQALLVQRQHISGGHRALPLEAVERLGPSVVGRNCLNENLGGHHSAAATRVFHAVNLGRVRLQYSVNSPSDRTFRRPTLQVVVAFVRSPRARWSMTGPAVSSKRYPTAREGNSPSRRT